MKVRLGLLWFFFSCFFSPSIWISLLW